MRMSSRATEWVACPVTVGGAAPAPSLPVAFAFLPTRAWPDAATTWSPGEWAAGSARILVGLDALALPAGSHAVFVRVVAAPETVILPAGILTVV